VDFFGTDLITEEVIFNVLTEVCSFINSEMPEDQQLYAIVEAANKLLGVKNSSLIMFDEQTQQLYFHLVTGEKSQDLRKLTMKPGEGIAGWVAEHGIPLVVPDVTKEPRYNPHISETLHFQTTSIICVPIRSHNKVSGSFEVVNRLDGRPFEAKDVPLLTAFAALIGIVLENAKNLRTNQQNTLELEDLVLVKTREIEEANKDLTVKTQRLALTAKIISLINSNRKMSEILMGVGKQLRKLVPLDYASVTLIQDVKELLLLEVYPGTQVEDSEGIVVPFDESVIKYVVQYKRSIFHNRPRWYRCFLEGGRFVEERLSTMLCMPIMASDAVVGTLNLASRERHEYPKEAIDVVTFVAKQLGVAFEREKLRNALEEVNQQLNEKAFELRKSIITMGDANLKLFNMQQQLREKDKRMKSLLEQVQSKNEELNATLAELKQTQTQLVQSEKMASLGQLVAGIAHELNTPAGAIKAASEIIPDYIQKTCLAYDQLIHQGMLADDRRKVLGLLDVMVNAVKHEERKSTSEIREQSKILTQRLKELGIAKERTLAKDIARCYLEDQLDTILELFSNHGAEPVMDFLTNCSRVIVSSRDNQLSIETISRIVKALKSYSYLDQAQERKVDLNEDLENTLTILHSQIAETLHIVKKFGALPLIPCIGSELNQVWTNILQNALQALEGQDGTITIETSATPSEVSVKISDSGAGIPSEIQDKIFDPFFTTKRGKSSGLGLSIAQQIVNKHHGIIQLTSVPGNTTVEIRLPKEGIQLNEPKKKTSLIQEESA